jgi:transposase
MAWTETTRPQYERDLDRYASDCTDEEWAIIEPFMPGPSRVGRPRKSKLREVWNAIQYIATTGCQWALLPKCFTPFTTVQYYFYRLRDRNYKSRRQSVPLNRVGAGSDGGAKVYRS